MTTYNLLQSLPCAYSYNMLQTVYKI